MLQSIRRRMTYANLIATLALFVAIGGTAVAADKYLLTSTKQISPSVRKALKGAKGPKGAMGARGPQGVAGAAGPAGAAGAAGANGAPAAKYWARIGFPSPGVATVLASSGGITVNHLGTANNQVIFPAGVDADACAFSITADTSGPFGWLRKSSTVSSGSTISVLSQSQGNATTDPANADIPFDIVAFC